MTEAQRVGQLFLVGIAGDQPVPVIASAVQTYHFGSLLFGADSDAGVAATREQTAAIQSLVSVRTTGGVRFFIAANQEGGTVQALTGPGFATMPAALVQGELTPATVRQLALDWGQELRSAGVNLDLAPVMDVVPAATAAQNQPIGALQREYGYDAQTVAEHGVAFIQGMRQAGVATTVKHFPGLGRVIGNTDFTADVVDTVTTADAADLASYQAGIDAGTPFVMVSLATYMRIDPDHLAVFSDRIVRGILRGQLRFRGAIMSDDLGEAAAVASVPPATRAVSFLNAGGDMITSQTLGPAEEMDAAVLAKAEASPSFRAEVRSAVLYVLSAKQAFGLLPCSAPGRPVTR
jgi:beta-N-acetylhexosaminidase